MFCNNRETEADGPLHYEQDMSGIPIAKIIKTIKDHINSKEHEYNKAT